jgi:hypothetical protein
MPNREALFSRKLTNRDSTYFSKENEEEFVKSLTRYIEYSLNLPSLNLPSQTHYANETRAWGIKNANILSQTLMIYLESFYIQKLNPNCMKLN